MTCWHVFLGTNFCDWSSLTIRCYSSSYSHFSGKSMNCCLCFFYSLHFEARSHSHSLVFYLTLFIIEYQQSSSSLDLPQLYSPLAWNEFEGLWLCPWASLRCLRNWVYFFRFSGREGIPHAFIVWWLVLGYRFYWWVVSWLFWGFRSTGCSDFLNRDIITGDGVVEIMGRLRDGGYWFVLGDSCDLFELFLVGVLWLWGWFKHLFY